MFDLNRAKWRKNGIQIDCQTVKKEIDSNKVLIRYETNDKTGKAYNILQTNIIST